MFKHKKHVEPEEDNENEEIETVSNSSDYDIEEDAENNTLENSVHNKMHKTFVHPSQILICKQV